MEAPQIQTIRSGALVYRTLSSRREAAPAFVLLHGIGASHRYLARLHRELAASATVVSFDLPGFGGMPKPPSPVSVEQYADLIGRALDHAELQRCTVVGHSMGSQFAVELARRRPELTTHVVLIGPVVDSRRRSVVRQAFALSRDGLREPPAANAMVLGDYVRCGPRWYLTELRVMMSYPTEERIESVDAPVLVLRGARDPVAGSNWSAALAARAPRGRLLEVPGSGHVVQQSAPRVVADAIRDFVLDPSTVGVAL